MVIHSLVTRVLLPITIFFNKFYKLFYTILMHNSHTAYHNDSFVIIHYHYNHYIHSIDINADTLDDQATNKDE